MKRAVLALGLGLWLGWRAADRRYATTLTVNVEGGETVYRARRVAETWDPIPPIVPVDIPTVPIR